MFDFDFTIFCLSISLQLKNDLTDIQNNFDTVKYVFTQNIEWVFVQESGLLLASAL